MTKGSPGNKPARAAERLVVVLFGVYVILLTWIVLWKLELPYAGGDHSLRVVKLVPFLASAGAGASAPDEVVANVTLFVPFGLYVGLLAPSWPWWKAAVPIAGASLLLETVQYVLAVGIADVSDLLSNTVGGVVGLGLLALVRRPLKTRTTSVLLRVCSIGTVLTLLAIGLFVGSGLRYVPPPGAAVLGHVMGMARTPQP